MTSKGRDDLAGMMMPLIGITAIVALGTAYYAMSSNDWITSSNKAPAEITSTTGQGATR
jgi:hypothetical protein